MYQNVTILNIGYSSPEYTKEAPSEETVQNWVTVATCACSWLTLGGEDAAEHPRGSLPDRMPLCRALLAVVQLLSTLVYTLIWS